jgi:TolA-binding protein
MSVVQSIEQEHLTIATAHAGGCGARANAPSVKERSAMSRANKALVVFVVALCGIWGCAQGPTNGAASQERIKALESKCTKLEDDYRAVAATRDQLRKKLTAADEERARMEQELEHQQAIIKERDELRQSLNVRTGERDAVQTQYDAFRKNIRSLLGQADSAATLSTQPVSSAPPPS